MFHALLQAAAQTAQTAAAALPATLSQPTDNPYASLGLAAILPFVLQAAKNATWFPYISRASGKLNFCLGLILAALATAGVHLTYDPLLGGTITLPSLHALWQTIVQWGAQQAAYKGLVVPAETLGEIRGMLERTLTPPPISEGAAKADDAERTQP